MRSAYPVDVCCDERTLTPSFVQAHTRKKRVNAGLIEFSFATAEIELWGSLEVSNVVKKQQREKN